MIMNRHTYFKKRLKELGVLDKNSEYNGLIGKWVRQLSATLSTQGHRGSTMVITVDLLNQLMIEWNEKYDDLLKKIEP